MTALTNVKRALATTSAYQVMTDRIAVTCSRCKTRFKERIARLRDGNQGQCPNCSCFINYNNESMDLGVRRAMTEARRVRNAFMAAPVNQ
jgi:hypothetical protein